ncbi:hypothetical protein CY0110_19147 [Crocosphaera chwakensis CCY0110]|uniref:Uncharacterized protein n=1 Tax=Crocosphaera chwakensis CCY0110 TaxID=391612 RepID=A3IJG1_9CHRO|nr:hypothetical protein CY0110_19147 [Crocosphaera chwakensis CCY0110]
MFSEAVLNLNLSQKSIRVRGSH